MAHPLIVIVLLLFDIGALGGLKSRVNAKFSFKKLIVKTACEKIQNYQSSRFFASSSLVQTIFLTTFFKEITAATKKNIETHLSIGEMGD